MEQATVFLIAMIVITNPVGNLPIYFQISNQLSLLTDKRIILRMMAISFVMMIITLIAGPSILSFIGVSLTSFSIAGGIIISHIGYSMLVSKSHSGQSANQFESQNPTSAGFIPLSFPLLAGPGTLATIMIHTSHVFRWETFAIETTICLIACLITGFVYYIGSKCEKYISSGLISIFVRIGGLILLTIGVQILLTNIHSFLQ